MQTNKVARIKNSWILQIRFITKMILIKCPKLEHLSFHVGHRFHVIVNYS